MNKTEFKQLFLIIVIFISAAIETDIYLPAFPDMMTWFSVTEGEIQSLLTWNFLGICLFGPFYGPLSDSFGRKKPLLVALGIFLIGSLITLISQNLDQMLWGRILQGCGSGGCFTLGTAIIFDAFTKKRAISAVNNLNTIIPLIMALAPMIGAYLNHHFGFRSNFLAIAVFVTLSFLTCLFFFQETHSKERAPLRIKTIFKDFSEVIKSLAFWQITLMCSVIFGGYIAFLSGTSVLFVVEFGMSKSVFPFIQALLLGGWVAASLMLNQVVAKWGIAKVKKLGAIFISIGGIGGFFFAICLPRDPYFISLAMMLYSFGANWTIGLYFPEGMELFPKIKGITASLLTSARLAIAAIIVSCSGSMYNGTIYPLALIILGTIILILPTIIFYEKKRPSILTETTNVNIH